ncbi:DUF6438 domain-containing protein [Hyunsoonleella pacifica]|uniref:DUF6438 domain-containing protein n=1 Tax=Hyunsoonleella pacifica TaxID=1080224 RepID=A0A4Q9FJ20_9FLAO|nr:hypothetical protein [Hyunsoonleella pacifica]TBN12486.1 hypothetical protein EYD46_17365 [Hyunsoonleella pacifica]GGD29105.1 hypothetical protein GCM10011368_33840 [Hyunsoonleella pacifica]
MITKNLIFFIGLLTFCLQSLAQIQKIEFSTDGYANGADYDLVIYSDKVAVYNARSDNYSIPHSGDILPVKVDKEGNSIIATEIKGIFITNIESKLYKEIIKEIEKLNEEFSKKKYFENSLHVSTSTLKVTFKDGDVKFIYDYGMKGTKTLVELYKILDSLRFNQKWK